MNVRGFASLAKMHRFRMDEHRGKAAEVEAVRADLMARDTELEQQLLHEKSTMNPDDLAMTNFSAYLKGVEDKREELAKSITDIARTLARISEQMAIEFREAKKFELAMEREIKRQQAHIAKLEQAELDEIGLNKYDDDDIRLLPDGRPLEIIVETAGEDTEQTDVLELIAESWAEVGVKLFIKPSQREVFRNRVFSGQAQMSIWSGLENGVATAATSPEELAPTSQQQLMWPKWGQYFDTSGVSGEAPDLPEAQELAALAAEWKHVTGQKRRAEIWHRMLSIHAEQIFSIGVIAGVQQPVVVKHGLKNVPMKGIYNWDPGAHFGIYRPDTFWFDR